MKKPVEVPAFVLAYIDAAIAAHETNDEIGRLMQGRLPSRRLLAAFERYDKITTRKINLFAKVRKWRKAALAAARKVLDTRA